MRRYDTDNIGILGEINREEQNGQIFLRLKKAKSQINNSCPKCFKIIKKKS